MKKRTLAIAVCAAAVLMAGCGNSETQSAETVAQEETGATEAVAEETEAAETEGDSEEEKGTSDNVLKVQIGAEVASMDPQLARDNASFEVLAAVTEGLYTVDADGNAVPAMVEKEEISEDGLTRTYTLKDAKWSNGDPVTANDFVFAWRRAADPETASQYAFMMDTAGIKNAQAVAAGEIAPEELGVYADSDNVLRVELERPVAFFDTLMSFPTFLPVSQSFYEECGDQFATSLETINCNGPFVLTSYEPAAMTIETEKNPEYWDASNVSLDGIEFQVIKEAQEAALAFETGVVDLATISGDQVEKYSGTPEFNAIQTGYLWFLSPNTEVEGLENLNMRMALALSFDKDQICEYVLKDGSIPGNFAVPVGLATGPDGKDFRDDPDGSRTYLTCDKEKAVEYFEKAKAELGKDSFEYTIIMEDTEATVRVAEFIQSEIQSTLQGVTINIEQMPKKNRITRVQEHDYDLALFSWGPDYADPMTYLDLWIEGGACNYGSWYNADYDALIDSCKRGELSVSAEERWEGLKDAEKMLMDNAVIFPVYQKCEATLMNSDVSGIEFHSISPNRVYKNAEKQ